MDGRVLRLVAAPGTRVMGLETTAGQSSGTVIEMYDPDRLQVRADVRLEDVPMVMPGQPVEIETASSPVAIEGRVLQSTSSANIQKNTLEVKVELIDPPPSVSPEMLVTATFLALQLEQSDSEATETERLFAPKQLIQSGASGSFAWVVDAAELARQQPVEVGSDGPDDLIEIKSGLRVTDKLIASGTDGLTDGSAVNVTGDDQTMGMGQDKGRGTRVEGQGSRDKGRGTRVVSQNLDRQSSIRPPALDSCLSALDFSEGKTWHW